MKKIIILSSILLILVIGVIIGYIFLTKDSNQSAKAKLSSIFGGTSNEIKRSPSVNSGFKENFSTSSPKFTNFGLQKLFPYSVAGFVVFEREKNTTIRFVEQETGHVFDINMGSTSAQRISNTTIPRVAEALWTIDGKYVALRYLGEDRETLKTFVAKIQKNTTPSSSVEEEGSLVGTFFPQGITTLSSNTLGSTFFYILNTQNGSEGIITSPEGKKTARIFSSPLQEWGASYLGKTKLALLTKPSANISGFLYFFNTSTGVLTHILGDIPGLSTLVSPDRQLVLFSKSSTDGISLNIFNIKTNKITPLSMQTLAEKCTWGLDSNIIYCAIPTEIKAGLYPDLWYQGRVSFSDEFWKIDLETKKTTLLLNPKESVQESIDAKNLSLSTNKNFLFFINKKDSTLWSIALPQKESVESN